MKKTLCLISILLILNVLPSFSQNVGIGTKQPNPSAALDISDSTRGLLMPRLTSKQRMNIKNPATGLMIYQVGDSSGVWYFDKQWNYISNSPQQQNLVTSGIAIFDDISDFSTNAPSENLIFVKELMRGGFFYPYIGILAADNGMIFTDSKGNKWIRYVEGNKINVQWYGAHPVGYDDVTDNNYDAIMAAINFVNESVDQKTVYIPGHKDYNGHFYFITHTINLHQSISIEGEGFPTNAEVGLATHLYFPVNTVCVFLGTKPSGGFNTYEIKKLCVDQQFTTSPDANAHVFDIRSVTKMEDVYIRFGAGNGLNIHTDDCNPGDPSNPYWGSSDRSFYTNVNVYNCTNGFFITGCESNVINFTNINAVANRMWGVWDDGFLGNNYVSPHFATNGTSGNGGGPILISGENAYTTITSPYTEADQPPAQLNGRSMIINGDNGVYVAGGAYLKMLEGQMFLLNSDFYVPKDDPRVGVGVTVAEAPLHVKTMSAMDQPIAKFETPALGYTLLDLKNMNGGGQITFQGNTLFTRSYIGPMTQSTSSHFSPQVDEGMSLGIINQRWNEIRGKKIIADEYYGVWNGNLMTVAHGGTGLSSLNPYSLLTGGTTSIGNLQQVSGTGSAGQILTSNGTGAMPTWQDPAGAGGLGWGFAGNPVFSGAFLGTTNTEPLRLKTNSTERMIIDNTGHVGIGTSSPSSYLHISPSGSQSTGTSVFKITSNTGFGNLDLYNHSADGSFTMNNRFGTAISAFDVNSGLYDFYQPVRAFGGIRVLGSLTTANIGGYNWNTNSIYLDNPWVLTYQATGDGNNALTAHRFTVLGAMQNGASNLASFDNGGSSLFTIKMSGATSIGTIAPHASAELDVSSTSKGFLPSRMTTTQRNGISSPAEGLIIYNSVTHKLNVYTGSAWEEVSSF
jgi:hypothetical protein